MSIVNKAMKFARYAHKYQTRKYTETPYFEHLAQVAGLVSSVTDDAEAISAAWLHDVIEDCGLTYERLSDIFSKKVAYFVLLLSDLETGNRAERKRLSRQRLRCAPPVVQTIKVADIISNTPSIAMYGKKFSELYLKEVRLMMDELINADPVLREISYDLIEGVKVIKITDQDRMNFLQENILWMLPNKKRGEAVFVFKNMKCNLSKDIRIAVDNAIMATKDINKQK